jgi:hypothetical protein
MLFFQKGHFSYCKYMLSFTANLFLVSTFAYICARDAPVHLNKRDAPVNKVKRQNKWE